VVGAMLKGSGDFCTSLIAGKEPVGRAKPTASPTAPRSSALLTGVTLREKSSNNFLKITEPPNESPAEAGLGIEIAAGAT
jgi:hypothetical protein